MIFALAILVGAFTLFFLEPFCGKVLTPWLGGGAAVWGTCLVYFQVLLLGGYVLAHSIAGLAPRRQFIIWTCSASVAWLSLMITWRASGVPFLPPMIWFSGATDSPVQSLLLLLLRMVTGPFLLLAMASSLLQAWYGRVYPGKSPFRLYALSNLGSFLGLLSYPLLAEPLLATSRQGWILLGLLGVFTLFMGWAAWIARNSRMEQERGCSENLDRGRFGLWVLASASGSLLLVGASTQLAYSVISVPLVWILPLGLYLLTFVLVFDAHLDFGRPSILAIVSIITACVYAALIRKIGGQNYSWTMFWIGSLVFWGCLLCHGFLHAIRPSNVFLTKYYMAMALGGAFGGTLGALVAPLVFNHLFELPIAVSLAGFCGLLWINESKTIHPLRLLPTVGLIGVAWFGVFKTATLPGASFRDFFGVVSVLQVDNVRQMVHGQIAHGLQIMNRPDLPLAYYGKPSGIGRAVNLLRSRKAHLRIGILGLGAGATAAYAREGDEIRIYEISPLVGQLAGPGARIFTYVSSSPAKVEMVLGDGRLKLAEELHRGSQNFDILLVDAFVGGQIPWHLLTREALDLYLKHLSKEGMLALHLSTDIPLERQVTAQAFAMDLWGVALYHPSKEMGPKSHELESMTTYLLLSRTTSVADEELVALSKWAMIPQQTTMEFKPEARLKGELGRAMGEGTKPWTDDFNDMGGLLWLESTKSLYKKKKQILSRSVPTSK